MFSASPSCLLPLDLMPGLQLDGTKGVFDPRTGDQGSLAPGLVKTGCFAPHTERRRRQRAQATPQEGEAPKGLKGTPLSLLPTLPPLSAPACFPERKPATLLFFFILFFFFFSIFLFLPARAAGPSWGAAVPAGARCRRGGAGGARRPRGDKAGDGPRGSRPHCVSEEEMDEGHILPLFRCPAPGKSCAL